MKNVKRTWVISSACILIASTAIGAEKYYVHSFERLQLTDQFFCEGASFADVNQDGNMDVVSGPYWYAGPDFDQRNEYYPVESFDVNGYSGNFLTYAYDVDQDKWPDVMVIGFPGEETYWYQNPKGKAGHWQQHLVHPVVDNESPTVVDITGDGNPELVFHTGGQLGYAGPNLSDPTQPWEFHAISPKRDYQKYTHGLGVGDVNGDGRMDMLEKGAWWEHPEGETADGFWQRHEFQFSEAGGAQMFAYDFDGDGDNDVITSKAAHAYGLAWFENVREGDAITFREHKIMGETPEENDYGVVFSQLHSQALVDMDRDGVLDIVTGKRYWAHNGNDPGARDPAVNYWFQTVREGGKVRFVPHKIDLNSGVGTQVTVGDLNGDEWPDVVVGNKKGTFALVHHAKEVDKATWQNAQPKSTKPSKAQPADDQTGMLPTGLDGKPLNLDLEAGSLGNWIAKGEAFAGQPIRGDTVHSRRSDSKSEHQGEYWIGSFEKAGDGPVGTLASTPFRVAHRWASFLVGGGEHRETRVEIVRKDTSEVVHQASGSNRENLKLRIVDLQEHMGEEIFLRLVDEHSGGWGHINFDNFRFHTDKPGPVTDSTHRSAAEGFQHAGLTPDGAATAMTVPEGFSVQAYAGEPDVKQPIAMAIDDRGRIWVAEAYEYPRRASDGEGRDRILIFEDNDGDGKFDKRKVFAEGLNLVSGLEVGFGGIWVGASPYLYFIPDHDGDDIPDGEPQVLLDGWHYEDTHETLNAFIWGPDGWLYGCHGVFTHSVVGKPGTPEEEREPINAGVWRYHPTRHEFEVFAHGTSNPWGVDFNDHGQMFTTACVIPHLYHMVQGARYQRQGGQHFNSYTYDDIKTIADHAHYAGSIGDHAWWGGRNSPSADNSTDAAGGGHAHAGAMIYLGGSWPERYRNQIFMNNIHGARLNQDILVPRDSGYVGQHGPDFLLANDVASQIINMRYGPDGQVYFIDWYDMQQCHRRDPSAHDRENGRVFRVAYNNQPPVQVDLKQLTDEQLVELQLHANDWHVRHARRILQERSSEADLQPAAVSRLVEIATTHQDDTRRLRALWCLHVTGNLPSELAAQLAADESPYVRGWAIQVTLVNAAESPSPELVAARAALSHGDPSQVVRLYLASACQRIPLNDRWEIIQGLLSHSEDANDHNLPLMLWYAFEPLVPTDMSLSLTVAQQGKFPVVLAHTIRRIAELGSDEAIALLVAALDAADEAEQTVYLNSMSEALKGSRSLAMPENWTTIYARLAKSGDDTVRTQARRLAVKFGDPRALDETRTILTNADSSPDARKSALESLLGAKDAKLAPVLQGLVSDKSLRREALRGLASYDDANTASIALDAYASFTADERRDALNTLASRPEYASALLDAIIAKRVASLDLTADLIRQLNNLRDEAIKAKVGEIWGMVRETAADKKEQIVTYRGMIEGDGAEPDPHLGRAIFAKTCLQCHKLFGAGHTIGPELTGSNRANLDYLLTNVVDPSAVMAKEYQPTVFVTDSGRTITGLVQAEDDRSLTVATANETIVVPRDEIDEQWLSETSMMPDNQWQQMKPHEIRSLVAYLASPKQVPILATAENAASFFNGQDLTGWTGDMNLWKVENGEIVGTSSGLKKNTFLVSDLAVDNFELLLKAKLTPNDGNSGIQFRSEALHDGEAKGYQADIGAGWWGKLYEENGRALLWDKSATEHVNENEWNEYRIVAKDSLVRTYLNGNLCVDLDDPEGARRGIIALQIHSGPAMEVRFKDLQLTVLPMDETARNTTATSNE